MGSSEQLTAQMVAFAHTHDSEVELALLVAQIIEPHPAPDEFRLYVDGELQQLAQTVKPDSADAAANLLDALKRAGFGQANPVQKVITAQHSHLGWVLANRRGIPISLAVVLIAVARHCDVPAWGVNYPGHFLVNLQGRLVDPLSLQFVEEEHLLRDAGGPAEIAKNLQPATPQSLVLRMLNNLKALQMSQQDWSAVLDLIDYQVAVCANDDALVATLEYERGQCWVQLGAYSVAADAFAQCAEKTEEPELARQALSQVQRLRHRQEILH